MQPLAKHQIFLPSWPVLTFGHRDSEETRCLKPCTLITYLVIDPISLLGQLNELPVKRRTSAFICTLSSVYFGIKPPFFNITWHELQLGWKWSRLKTWNFPGATTLSGLRWLSQNAFISIQCIKSGFQQPIHLDCTHRSVSGLPANVRTWKIQWTTKSSRDTSRKWHFSIFNLFCFIRI